MEKMVTRFLVLSVMISGLMTINYFKVNILKKLSVTGDEDLDLIPTPESRSY